RLRGGTTLMMPFEPEAVIRTIEEHRITVACVAPSMIWDLLDSPALGGADLSSLEVVLYGSAPAAPARLAEALEVLGPPLSQGYASTEGAHAMPVLPRPRHTTE